MNRSDLVTALATHFHQLDTGDVDQSVKVILDAMAITLSRGGRIELRGFGSFSLNYRGPRMGRNPKTGEYVAVPARCFPHFKTGKNLRERVLAGSR